MSAPEEAVRKLARWRRKLQAERPRVLSLKLSIPTQSRTFSSSVPTLKQSIIQGCDREQAGAEVAGCRPTARKVAG